MNYELKGAPDYDFPGQIGDTYTDTETGRKYELTAILSVPVIHGVITTRETHYSWEKLKSEGGSGGGDTGGDSQLDALIDGSITEITSNATSIRDHAFYNYYDNLTTVDFPLAISIGTNAFSTCRALTTANIPNATSIGSYAFKQCVQLTTTYFPAITSIGMQAFHLCSALTTVDFPLVTSIGNSSFEYCVKLTSIILRNESMVALSNKSAFNNTPIASGTGYIYVPRALVDTYKSATNWSTYASQFRALEDYTVDGTITGELDPTKI